MGILGSITGSSFPISAPESGLQIIGIKGYSTSGSSGYVSINIDNTRLAQIPFSFYTGQSGSVVGNNNSPIFPVNFTLRGLQVQGSLNGIPNVALYYGKTILKDSVPLESLAGVAVASAATMTYTFPAGPVRLMGAAYIPPGSPVGTASANYGATFNWAVTSGKVITLTFMNSDPLAVVPFGPDEDGKAGLRAASSLTVTGLALGGTLGGTLILYYQI